MARNKTLKHAGTERDGVRAREGGNGKENEGDRDRVLRQVEYNKRAVMWNLSVRGDS